MVTQIATFRWTLRKLCKREETTGRVRDVLNRKMWQVEPQKSQSTEVSIQGQGGVQLLEEELWRASATLKCSDN